MAHMSYDFTTTVEIDLDDVLDDMTASERRELFDELRKRVFEDLDKEKRELLQDVPRCDPKELATETLRDLPPFEIKRILVNALGVPSYYADESLRNALEPIITAR